MGEIQKGRDWEKVTWEGASREELRRWRALSLVEKLNAVDELLQLGEMFMQGRREKGLPYFDPVTGLGVSGRQESS